MADQPNAQAAPDPMAKVLADPKTQMEIAQERASIDADKETLAWAKNMQTWMQSDPVAAQSEWTRVMGQMHPAQAKVAQAALTAHADADDPVHSLRADVEALKRETQEERRARDVKQVNTLVDETLGVHEIFRKGSSVYDETAHKIARKNLLAEGAANPSVALDRLAAEAAGAFMRGASKVATAEHDARVDQQANMTTLPPSQGAPQVTTPRKAKVDDWSNGKREEQYKEAFKRDGLRGVFGRNFGGR